MYAHTQKARDQRCSKAEAGYVELYQSGETCADCQMFGPNTCDKVEGSINPRGWCWFFSGHKQDHNRRRHR